MSDHEFSDRVLVPELRAAGLEAAEGDLAHDGAWYDLLSSILKPRTVVAPDVVEKARFLYQGNEVELDEKSVEKNLAKAGARGFVTAATEALEALDSAAWHADAINAALEALPEKLGASKRKFFGAVRVAACGNQVSPPLGESLELLGRDCTLARLRRAEGIAAE